MKKNHPFREIYDANSKILILGSLPSVRSTEVGFYYMHPQNRFWKILAHWVDREFLNESIEVKTNLLHQYHIALFDVISSCEIINSSDASISKVHPQNIPYILEHSSIQKIILNGKTAYKYFLKFYPELASMAYLMPSTSAANARCSLEELFLSWKEVFK